MGSSASTRHTATSTSMNGVNMNNNRDLVRNPSIQEGSDATDVACPKTDVGEESPTPADKNDNGEEPTKELSIEEQKESIAEAMAYLNSVDEFATEKCLEKCSILAKISMNRADRLELGKYITELGFADMYLSVHRDLYSHDLFNIESGDEFRKQAQINLRKMRVPYWNFTDCTQELCAALGKNGALKATIKELEHPELCYDKLKKDSKGNVVQGVLGVLHNCIRLHDDNRAIYREAGAVEILHTLMKCTFLIVRVQCLLILSYIITEEESEKITASDGSIDTLLTWIREALRTKNHKTKRFGFSVLELAEGLNNLALNDANKVKIVQKGGIDPVAKMLTQAYSEKEQNLAACLAWKLAFVPSNRPVVQQNTPLINALTALRTSENAALREACTGALWETYEGKIDVHHNISHYASDKHIMISYQWDVQKRMVMIKDELINEGYRVWMDVDRMEGDILGAMAEAVENSAVLLVGLSRKYKESQNTRTEATYAYKQNIPIIPLLVEENYNADGWLGALVGTLLYFKFYEYRHVEQNLPYLLQEIGNRGKGGTVTDSVVTKTEAHLTKASPPRSKAQTTTTSKVGRTTVATWDSSKVQAWLEENRLSAVGPKMADCDGELLVQMHKQSQRAPEYFHSTLQRELGLDFMTILKLTSAMDKLMT